MTNRPKVWGIGLGRTGTKSLYRALQILGYQNILHNPPYLSRLRDVEASIEGVTLCSYPVLAAQHLHSKFILTTRELNGWLGSCRRAMEEYPLERIPAGSRYHDAMVRNRLNRYGSLTYRPYEMTQNYYRHHSRVLDFFKDKRDMLLEMNIIAGEGWEALCSFLEIPVPDVPFPVQIADISP